MSKKITACFNYDREIPLMEVIPNFYSLYYSDIPGQAHIQTHFHRTIEVMLVVSGTVSVSVEGAVYSMQEGDLSVVQPGRMHRTLIHTPGKQYIRYVLHLDPDFIRDFIRRKGLDAGAFDYLFRCCVLHCRREDTLFASSLLERLYTLQLLHAAQDTPSFQCLTGYSTMPMQSYAQDGKTTLPQYAYAQCLVEELLLYFAIYNNQVKPQTIPLTNPLVEKIIEYINENYLDPNLSLKQVAQAMFVSQGYLSRTFKKYSGGSLYNYVIQKRLAYSQTMLQNNAGVLDACIQSGFRDYSSFLKAFRAAYQLTPREYVARCRAAAAGRERQ